MKFSLLSRLTIAGLVALPLFTGAAQAGTEVLFPVEDAFIIGGTRSGEVNVDSPTLFVAARTQETLQHVRKIFLLFEPLSPTDNVGKATLKLTHHGEGIVALPGDPITEIDLLLYGAPGGDWSEETLTWDSAPFHDPSSYSDEGNPGLELLAEVRVDTSAVNEDAVLEFSDPRIAEFVRKNPERMTLVITSRASADSPGLRFFDSDETGRDDRKPRLVLEMK